MGALAPRILRLGDKWEPRTEPVSDPKNPADAHPVASPAPRKCTPDSLRMKSEGYRDGRGTETREEGIGKRGRRKEADTWDTLEQRF